MDGLQVVDAGGSCALTYRKLAALYFDCSTTVGQRSAFMEIIASFFPGVYVAFPHVRMVTIVAKVRNGHLFRVSIPGILWMTVDRNWEQPTPPFPFVAAPDLFSNLLQYAENIQYVMHDAEAKLNFDYSRRQANYRVVDLGVEQYRSRSMLIQYVDGMGQFNKDQLRLIHEQHLLLPDLAAIRQEVQRLR
jgi:DNA-directed RNA polymerase subunit N (RpoN/RPB10)